MCYLWTDGWRASRAQQTNSKAKQQPQRQHCMQYKECDENKTDKNVEKHKANITNVVMTIKINKNGNEQDNYRAHKRARSGFLNSCLRCVLTVHRAHKEQRHTNCTAHNTKFNIFLYINRKQCEQILHTAKHGPLCKVEKLWSTTERTSRTRAAK